MTPEQKRLIMESWQVLEPEADMVADIFYDRLFALEPELTDLFENTDLDGQKRKLLQALSLTVASLDELPTLVPLLQDLGSRHVGYQVEDTHYDTVGAALLSTLEQGLGTRFSKKVADAWASAYKFVSDTMKDGANRARLADKAA